MEGEQIILNDIERLKYEKLLKLQENGKDPFKIEKFDQTHHSKEIKDNFEDFDGKEVSVAGRMMSFRSFGKATFIDIQDKDGRIQSYVRKDQLGEELYKEFKEFDIGDIVGVTGIVFKTQKDEISIKASSIQLLSKSLRILPEKYHGLKDMDLRYRQRYVDLIVNPEVKEAFLTRNKAIKALRDFLEQREFIEVETPILNTIAGGAAARPFITHHNTLDIDMYLRIANELYLKRLIVGGFEKVYEMGRMFRNEGMDMKHNPEYTAMELYQAYADYEDIMKLTEEAVAYMAEAATGSTLIEYQGKQIDLKPPWRRLSMTDAIKQYANIDFDTIKTDEEAVELAKEHAVEIIPEMTRGHVISAIFEKYCEEKLIEPTFITHHPVEISPLSKRNPDDPRITNRFEAFVNTWEIANAFSELNDPIDQRARFMAQLRQRELGDEEAQMLDEDFLNAIEVGMPPTGGLGIGIDRVIMLLTNSASIRDVILFPTMKPMAKKMSENQDLSSQDDKSCNESTTDLKKIDLSKVKVEPLFEDMVDFEKFSESDFRVVKVKNCEEVPKSNKLLKFTLDDGTEKDRIILSGIKNYYSAEELIGKTLLAITNLPERKMMGEPSQGMLLSAVYEYNGEEALNLIMLDGNIPAGAKIY